MNPPTIQLPEASRFPFTPDLTICRLPVGMWQVSGAHGPIDPAAAVRSLFELFDAGHTTFDLADIYGPAEDILGEFRRRLAAERGAEAVSTMQVFTKWVPRPGTVSRALVEQAVARSCRRLGMDALDLVQFHWWDYGDKGYLDALKHLASLEA